jgi:hypothetical protein
MEDSGGNRLAPAFTRDVVRYPLVFHAPMAVTSDIFPILSLGYSIRPRSGGRNIFRGPIFSAPTEKCYIFGRKKFFHRGSSVCKPNF